MYRKAFLLLAIAGLLGQSRVNAQAPVTPVGPSGSVTVTTQPVAPTPVDTRSATGQQQVELVPIGPATTYQMQNPQVQATQPAIGYANQATMQPHSMAVPHTYGVQGQIVQPHAQLSAPQYGAVLPPTVVNTPGNVLTQGIPIPYGVAPITSAIPQPTVAVTNMYGPQPVVGQQTQIYTPTYYYYYYQQPYQAPAAPVAQPVLFYVGDNSMGAGGMSQFGPMMNARGEAGHVRYPYYSYRRPWYFPGQPSFNVTIDGPAW